MNNKATLKPMLARTWKGECVRGWWQSEKLDGVRAIWTGTRLLSRYGNEFSLPAALKRDLPKAWLDGELWAGRGTFLATVGRVRRKHTDIKNWEGISFMVFDAPDRPGTITERIKTAAARIKDSRFARIHKPKRIKTMAALKAKFKKIKAKGGEGLVLRDPESPYVQRRSCCLLKLKKWPNL